MCVPSRAAQLKQLYESQWKRRLAMNTERERDKLMMKEEELDRHRDQRAWDAKSCLAGVVSNKQSLPANLYLQVYGYIERWDGI
jgi:hypothetical protein